MFYRKTDDQQSGGTTAGTEKENKVIRTDSIPLPSDSMHKQEKQPLFSK